MADARLDIDHIVDTAAQEFALHGFERMSMRTLAEKCSATAASLYYHFSSTDKLFVESAFVSDFGTALIANDNPRLFGLRA